MNLFRRESVYFVAAGGLSLAVMGCPPPPVGGPPEQLSCSVLFRVPDHFVTIDFPGAVSTHPRGIDNNPNQAGEASIVGYFVDAQGRTHGFRRDPGTTFMSIDIPDATDVRAFGINDAGTIVGTVVDGKGQRAFQLAGGAFTTPGAIPEARAINQSGMIAGSFSDTAGKFHGFTQPPGIGGPINVFANLSTQVFGINKIRQLVGTATDSQGVATAFYLDGPDIAGALKITIPGASRSDGFGINDADVPRCVRQVGTFVKDGINHGFVHLQAGNLATVDVPAAKQTQVFGVNNAGEMVGEFVDAQGVTHGFLDTF